MTATGEPVQPLRPEAGVAPRPTRRRTAAAVLEVCPFLATEGNTWRSAYAAREHRCQAIQPPAQLAISKQRQLCLLPAHSSCATYLAATALAVESMPRAPGDDGAALWPATASTALVLEPARRMGALPGASARSGGQALLVGLMVLAFTVLVIARTQSPGGGGVSPAASDAGAAVVGSPSPVATLSDAPSASAVASPSESPGASPSPAVSPTASPSRTASPRPTATPIVATRTYRVRSGDTLSSIAARFKTRVAVLAALNGITDPRLIHVGQVLKIP